MKAWITIGVSASGKTTWAEENKHELNANIICRDDIRKSLILSKKSGKLEKNWSLWKHWNFKWEKEVTEIYNKAIKTSLENGKNIICADTNLNPSRRANLKKYLEDLGFEVEFIKFSVTYEEAVIRDAQRKDSVGSFVIARQFEQWHEQFTPKWNKHNDELEDCIIFDIDGTLAQHNGRSPYEWHRVHEDTPIEAVEKIIHNFYKNGTKVVFLSGRDGVSYENTFQWIRKHCPYIEEKSLELYMRPKNDNRPDTEIKEELFVNHIQGKYNVIAVFDDRPKVCRMWRSHSLFVIQIGNPYIEF